MYQIVLPCSNFAGGNFDKYTFIISEENVTEIESFMDFDKFSYLIKPINKNVLISFISLILKQRSSFKA